LRGRVVRYERKQVRALLGVTYMVAAILAAALPFVAFGPTGLFVLVPTALWLAPALRTHARHAGNLTDGVVGWPGLTALVCAACGLALAALGGGTMASAWLGSCAACGLLEMARARIAKTDNRRAEFRSDRP
jgi:hypothetical protein